MHDVIVYDEEHQSASAAIHEALVKLDELFSGFVKELETVSTNGTIEGRTAESLRAYAKEASAVQKTIAKISGFHQKSSRLFLQDVDEADRKLF